MIRGLSTSLTLSFMSMLGILRRAEADSFWLDEGFDPALETEIFGRPAQDSPFILFAACHSPSLELTSDHISASVIALGPAKLVAKPTREIDHD
jgi:hypothetical protein